MTDRSNLTPGWTDDRVANLKTLWADGLSCEQIARRLGGGLSRNAVIGKAGRLNLPPRSGLARKLAQEIAGRAPARQTPSRRPPRTSPAVVVVARDGPAAAPVVRISIAGAVSDSLRLTIGDPSFRACRWPIEGDGADTVFCCAPRREGRIYCDAHHDTAHSAPRPPVVNRPGADPAQTLLRSLRRYV